MQLSNAPVQLVLPFAATGTKNTIPVTSQIGITAGAASLTDGFPPLTFLPVVSGGVPPFGADFNGILNELSSINQWNNAGAGYTYNSTFATNGNVLGYPAGARILRTDATGYWLNTIDNNQVNPESVTPGQAATAGWVPDATNGVVSVSMTSSNVTLLPTQYGKPVINLTGTLTANLNLFFPNISGQWIVANNCSGSFTVNCTTAAGTGVVLNTGTIADIYGDSTNIYNTGTNNSGLLSRTINTISANTTLIPSIVGVQLELLVVPEISP